MKIQDTWTRFEAWLKAHAPSMLATLQPGATEEQIAQAESFLSIQFPDDFKAAYRCHNGQVNYESGLIDGRELLSLERIQDEWKVWKELLDGGTFNESFSRPSGPIRRDWWHAQWIPFTYDGSGNHDCLDLVPEEGGQVGQVIEFWHDEDTRKVLAPSFADWFAAYVDGCEAGRYVFSEADGCIIDVNAL